MFFPSIPFSLLLSSLRSYFWNASDIPKFIIFLASSILHITTWFISLVPIWSLLWRFKTFNIFTLPTNLIQALHLNSQIISQPGPSLQFSSQHSEGLKSLSLGMHFRSHLVYPSIMCMNPSQHFNAVVMSHFCSQFQELGLLQSSLMFMTISGMCVCAFHSCVVYANVMSPFLRHLHLCPCSSHHLRLGSDANTAMKNDCGT